MLEEGRFMHSQKHWYHGVPQVVKENNQVLKEKKTKEKMRKEKKSNKWNDVETSVLLQCMVDGGCFSKGKLGVMHWDFIVEEINSKKNGGLLRTKEQCQNRFDVLLKTYKDLNAYCLEFGKQFCEVTEDEKYSLDLATPLPKEHEEWYNYVHTINNWRSSLRDQSHRCPKSKRRRPKCQKPNVDCDMDLTKLASSPLHPSQQCPPPLDVIGSSKSLKPSSREFVVKKFSRLGEPLRFTFLNIIQVLSLPTRGVQELFCEREMLILEVLCRRLAIAQDQNPLEICEHVYQLQVLKLVRLLDMDSNVFEDCCVDQRWVELADFEVYQKFGREVLNKNLHLDTFQSLSHIDTNLYVKVLSLYECQELETLDLKNFPHLCCLDILDCSNLKVVNGWESTKGLGWIEIFECLSYCKLPDVHLLSSLKEFYVGMLGVQRIPWHLVDLSPCVQLRRLEICDDYGLVESMDLKALRFLEVLSFEGCTSLSTIHGLSGLQTLMKLDVSSCKSLKVIPDLGCLKVLTYLKMSRSGIIEILGVEELHLLTYLHLCQCKSLESLPRLGHLNALAYLDLRWSSIEEILGVEDLVSLER